MSYHARAAIILVLVTVVIYCREGPISLGGEDTVTVEELTEML